MVYQELASLQNELEDEKSFRDIAIWNNNELSKAIEKLQDELARDSFDTCHDGELNKELSKNKQLLEVITTLRDQMPVLREKIRDAKVCGPDCQLKHDDLHININILTQSELLQLIKKFERKKTDLISTLKSKEFRLDSEAKLAVRLSDQYTYLRNELLLCENHLDKLEKAGMFRLGSCQSNSSQRKIFNKNLQQKLPPLGV